MRDFFMTKRQQFKSFREDGKTLRFISELMHVSLKTAKRWNKEWKEGALIRQHRLSNRKSNFSSKINKQAILKEYLDMANLISKDEYAEPYNFSYFVKYKLKEKCSLSTFKNIMKDNLVASPWANKKTKKTYNKILKARLKKKDLPREEENRITEIVNLNEKVYFRKPRPEHEGEIGETDACKDYWLGSQQSHLHAVYDPANRTVTAAWLEKEETTHGYYKLLEQLLAKQRVPLLFKGDCRSTFVINKKNAGALAHKDVNTQFGFVLNQIGVKMQNSSEPTFKGAIERFFRTAQNQLKGEFRERGIHTFEEANKYLQDYIKQFNDQYYVPPKSKEKKYIQTEFTHSEINELLSIRSFRITDKANSISYKNQLLSLYDREGNRVSFKEKSPILILETLDNRTIAKYMGNELILKPTDYQYMTGSQKEQYDNMKRLTPSFSAPDYHPWGYKVFALYLKDNKSLSRYLRD